jgi:hypothetical protein
MASIISAGTTSGTSLNLSADTSGQLELKTGSGPTTAITISSAQLTTIAKDASISGLTVGKGGGAVSTNTAVGASALAGNTTGINNTAIGPSTLQLNSTGNQNTAVGFQTLYPVTGGGNTGIGFQAGVSTTTGLIDAFGYRALYSNTTGTNNVAMGYQSLFSNTTAGNNTAVGYQSLYSSTTAPSCTAIGYRAGYNITTGQNNICVGLEAGSYSVGLTTGEQNIIIGNYTRTSAVNSQYQFVIGYDVVGQANNNITIGTASGKIYNAFTVNATWTQTSDGRLKKNIQDETLGLSFINRLKPVKYEWKASNELDKDNPYYAEENKRTTGVVMHGLVAQDVKAALDAEGVNTFAGWDEGSDGIQSISREMFISPLIKAIQELKATVDAQAARIAALEGAQ